MSKRPLVPSFLQALDDKLLRNKPATWSARTHLVLWFAFLFALVLSGFCYLAFFDAKQYSNVGGWATFIGLIVFIGFVFWMIFLLRFNVFKRYGNWFAWDGLKTFGLYFVSIAAMVALCFIPSAIETYRANQQFGNDEIVNDINELNSAACKLEYNLLPLHWKEDTCTVRISNPKIQTMSDPGVATEVVNDSIVYTDRPIMYHSIDTGELRRKLLETDSVVKLNDSLYVFFECPSYDFVRSFNADEYSAKKVLSSADIYRTILKNYQKPDKAALLKRMDAFKTKYAADSRYDSYNYLNTDYNEDDPYNTRIIKKYDLHRINNGIDNAVNKKYAWLNDWENYLRVFYYITLVLTLLVFIFRHSTVKTFFLSLLTAVILAIFTGLILVASRGDETSVLSFIIIYYLIFVIAAFTINAAKIRTALQGIALNLFVFMTAFMPVVFVAVNEANRYRNYQQLDYQQRDIHNTALYFFIAEITGAVILLVLLELVFRKLYRKWYAAPES
jgi:MFS family permease